jgi:hypothetical protein
MEQFVKGAPANKIIGRKSGLGVEKTAFSGADRAEKNYLKIFIFVLAGMLSLFIILINLLNKGWFQ